MPGAGATAVLTGLTSGYVHGIKAYRSQAECEIDYTYANLNNTDGRATGVLGAAPTKAGPIAYTKLSAVPISGGAVLALDNWSASDGDWWYRANVYVPNVNVDPHGPNGCRGPVTGGATQQSDTSLPSLTGTGAYYVFTVYPSAGCHYSKVAASAIMGNAHGVANLAKPNTGNRLVNSNGTFAGGFTTGGNAGSYTLAAVTLDFIAEQNPSNKASIGDLAVAIYDDSSGKPGALLTTLSGSNPKTAGNYDYTCSASCSLARNEDYHVVVSAPTVTDSADAYLWNYTNSQDENRTPAGNGWTIGNSGYRLASNTWNAEGTPPKFKVSAVPHVARLSASDLTVTGARLSIGGHPGSWYYQADKTPHNTCQGPVGGPWVALAGLSANTTYTYTAYSDSACTATLAAAPAFTTPALGSRASSKDFNTLIAAGNEHPRSIWSDGTTMWVVDNTDDKVYAYNLAGRYRDPFKDISLDSAGNWVAMTSDGTTMWLGDENSYTTIYAVNLATGARDSSKDITMSGDNDYAAWLWTDGVDLYVHDTLDQKIYVYNLASGAQVASKTISISLSSMRGIWSDGTTVWSVQIGASKVYAWTLAAGARDTSRDYTLDTSNTLGQGIWSDGRTFWVSDVNKKIYAYHTIAP